MFLFRHPLVTDSLCQQFKALPLSIEIEEDEMLQQTAIRMKLGFFGHVMRSDVLEKGMMLACGEGRRRRGRPRRR